MFNFASARSSECGLCTVEVRAPFYGGDFAHVFLYLLSCLVSQLMVSISAAPTLLASSLSEATSPSV
jgi:hypothetical protein